MPVQLKTKARTTKKLLLYLFALLLKFDCDIVQVLLPVPLNQLRENAAFAGPGLSIKNNAHAALGLVRVHELHHLGHFFELEGRHVWFDVVFCGEFDGVSHVVARCRDMLAYDKRKRAKTAKRSIV